LIDARPEIEEALRLDPHSALAKRLQETINHR
jgi:hypothetical protein